MSVKTWLKLLCFTFVIAPLTQAASKNPRHLGEGAPGCWKLVRQAALTTEEVKALPKFCQDFREDYFAVIELAKVDPKNFEKEIVDALNSAKQVKAPYEAIFFATLVHTENLKAALKQRASVEEKLKAPFAYAKASEFRLSGKKCDSDPHFSQKMYQEICDAEDSILPVFANQKKGST